jgi:hypothetical protein
VPAQNPAPTLEVRTWLEGDPAGGVGTLVVQVEGDQGKKLDLPEPSVPGLTFTEVDDPVQEQLGERAVTTRKFRFTGPPGSYEIPSLSVGDVDDTELEPVGASAPLWVDLGGPPAPLAIEDIEDPAPVFQVWPLLVLAGVAAGFLAGVVALAIVLARWRGLGRAPVALPPEPPDVLALRRWDAVRTDPALDPFARAVALATILRDYQEAVLGFPATTWTTSEILEKLQGMPHLPDGNVGRARRILRATDYIKFADEAAQQALFEELDDAFRAFVGTTRPKAWRGEP